MARARNIKPAFFLNTELSENSALGRLAFIGMWTISDYKGCLEYNPKKIKAQILPYDDCDMESLVINLDKSGFISIYSVQGKRYIKILNFEKHQNPHKNERESGSDIPDITEKDNEIIDLSEFRKNHEQDGTARADSLLLIPSTLIPESIRKTKKTSKELSYDDYPEFIEFWNAYPNKDSKYKALEVWSVTKPPIQSIMNALAWQIHTAKWKEKQGAFVPMATTYLNQKRWQDEPQERKVAF